jgi:hypothetical protein
MNNKNVDCPCQREINTGLNNVTIKHVYLQCHIVTIITIMTCLRYIQELTPLQLHIVIIALETTLYISKIT